MKNLVLLLAFVLLPSAYAYDYQKKLGVGADLGYTFPMSGNSFNKAAGSDFGYGAHAYLHFTSAWGLAGAYRRLDFDNVPQRAQVFDLMAFYRLMALERFTPVLGLGFGGVDFRDNQNIHLGARARLGGEYSINETWSAALNVDYQEVRQMPGADNQPSPSHVHSFAPMLSLTYYFDCHKAQTTTTAVKEKVKEVNSAFIDSDDDGVEDSEDKCANTAKGVLVNGYGCAEAEKVQIALKLEFESGKSTIRENYYPQLQDVADFMKKYPKTRAIIEGHTDNVGSVASNMKISTKRAQAVRTFLIEKMGIDAARLTAEGHGPKKPIADNNTSEGKAKNRRVIAIFSTVEDK